MKSRWLAALTLLILLEACSAANGVKESREAATRTATAVSHQGERDMGEGTYSGPIPEQLQTWYEQWIAGPLPEEALVKYQVISRGRYPGHNYRWVLYGDGRWFLARHSGSSQHPEIPFDTELPVAPTKVLPSQLVAEVESQLRQAELTDLEPYHYSKGVRDGAFYVITARLNGTVHEVIYEAVYPPLVEFLDQIIYDYGEE